MYYHWASFSNLTSFSNFSTTASILEILPYLKLWYFFNHYFGTGYEFSWIYYVLWVVQYADQCLQIAWLCNILDVAGPPDYLAIPNFYIISKHTKIDHNSRFGWFWEDLHENKKMYIQACQSVTSWDALSFQFGILLRCDIIWKARVKIIDGSCSLLWIILSDKKKSEAYLIHI